MVASIASFSSLNRIQGMMARAVSPAADAPTLRDQPQQPGAQHSASNAALAPVAMTALIEAQERLAQNAPALVRQHTAQKIDQLILQLADGTAPVASGYSVSFAVSQLHTAGNALSQSLVDLQA